MKTIDLQVTLTVYFYYLHFVFIPKIHKEHTTLDYLPVETND